MRRSTWASVVLVLMIVTAACGDDPPGVDVDAAWARSSPMMADAGAVYLQLHSDEADQLIGASVDPSIATRVEIHETVIVETDEGPTDDGMDEGMSAMKMQEIGEIALPAGETVSLEPGGMHIMLLQLHDRLEMGEVFDVTLQFEHAGTVVVEVEVRDESP